MNAQKPVEIATERYNVIAPIVTHDRDGFIDHAKITKLKKEASEKSGVSYRSIDRWITAFRKDGFDGLKPQEKKPSRTKLDNEWLGEAITLRRELPTRSVQQIIDIMEAEEIVPKGVLKRTTLQDNLQKAGFSSAQMRLYTTRGNAARRFARSERNDLWQSDIKYGPFIKTSTGSQQIYLVCFIDDATRYVVHAEFYDSLEQTIVEDCFRKAIMKHGVPDRVLFDNGKQYRTQWMKKACAAMEIRLIYAAPYSPEVKGKVEKFNSYVNSFFAEAALKHLKTLDDYNKQLEIWLSEAYHHKVHSGILKTPDSAWNESAKMIRFAQPEQLAVAFLHHEQRKVDKSGCISFRGKLYEVSTALIGKTVDISFDASDTSVITVEDEGLGISIAAKPLQISEHSGPRPKLPQSMSREHPETSRLLDAAASSFKNRREIARRAISFSGLIPEVTDDV